MVSKDHWKDLGVSNVHARSLAGVSGEISSTSSRTRELPSCLFPLFLSFFLYHYDGLESSSDTVTGRESLGMYVLNQEGDSQTPEIVPHWRLRIAAYVAFMPLCTFRQIVNQSLTMPWLCCGVR
jgi:hypothetical protein